MITDRFRISAKYQSKQRKCSNKKADRSRSPPNDDTKVGCDQVLRRHQRSTKSNARYCPFAGKFENRNRVNEWEWVLIWYSDAPSYWICYAYLWVRYADHQSRYWDFAYNQLSTDDNEISLICDGQKISSISGRHDACGHVKNSTTCTAFDRPIPDCADAVHSYSSRMEWFWLNRAQSPWGASRLYLKWTLGKRNRVKRAAGLASWKWLSHQLMACFSAGERSAVLTAHIAGTIRTRETVELTFTYLPLHERR